MPNQHAKRAITVRVEPDLLAMVREEVKQRDDTITAVVERAFREYVTPPPPPAAGSSSR